MRNCLTRAIIIFLFVIIFIRYAKNMKSQLDFTLSETAETVFFASLVSLEFN